MALTNGFLGEMVKLAGLGSFMKNLAKNRTPGKMGIGKALGLTGLAGGGAYLAGKSEGEGKGMENMSAGMQQAYSLGVQRGANYVIQRMRQMQGKQES